MAVDHVRRVFVYGSLLHEPSLMRTLAHRSAPPPTRPYVLDGWERAWNVVSARTFAVADGLSVLIHRRLVLGLRPTSGACCEGVVLDLTDADLAALAPREAAYELAQIGMGGSGPVWTFVPRPERVLGAAPVAEPLVVEQSYLDEIRAGIAAHGLTGAGAELDRSLHGLRTVTAAS